MFAADTSTGSPCGAAGLPGHAGRVHTAVRSGANSLRVVAVCALLATGLPAICSAQAIGTMQVDARVVPAAAAWAGVAEAGLAARAAVGAPADRLLIRRNGLVRAATEIRIVGSRREVLVTIQHPHN